MEEPTTLEKLTGNVLTKSGLAAIVAVVGSPLAALLPILTETLAAGRHRARVEKELERLEAILKENRHKLDTLTDPQFKLMNEIVIAVLQNTEDEKLEYLRRAMVAGFEKSEISHTISAQVSRALRDMTAGELAFVVAHSENTVMIGPIPGGPYPDAVESNITVIDRNSADMIYVSGLMGLGIINPAGSLQDDSGRYVFANFCGTLKELIESKI